MKHIKILSLIVLITIIASCSSTNEPTVDNQYKDLLKVSKNTLDSAITAIFDVATSAGKNILSNNFDEAKTRLELTSILTNYPTVIEVVYVDAKSIMTYVEPVEYKSSEGADISNQEHQIQMLATNKNAMSGIFKVIENFYAIVLSAPIIDNGKYMGSVNIVIRPDLFISHYTEAYLKNKVDDFVVMETNGNMLYDIDPTQTGKNLFTDSLYAVYPELLTAGNIIVKGEEGQTQYSFLDKGKNKTVIKDVWWTTSSYFGKIWKLSVIKERQ